MTWHPDIPEEYRNQIVTGDARELAKRIPDESIDLIFTDPVYDRIEDYEWLAKEGSRILRPHKSLIIQCGHYHLPDIFAAINNVRGLKFCWLLAERFPGQARSLVALKIIARWKPYIWYTKGNRNGDGGWINDMCDSTHNAKYWHRWGNSPAITIRYMNQLTKIDEIIFDPFTGSGTVPAVCKMLKRNYIAFEIDPDTAELARERVQNTQPPLFVLEPEQQELDI